MEFLRNLLYMNPLVLIVLINVLLLVRSLLAGKAQVRWGRLFQLLIFDAAALGVAFSGVPLWEMSNAAWISIAALILWPLILYLIFLIFVSFFLLPIEIKNWRQWFTPAEALVNFARGINYPYYSFDEETNELDRQLEGNIVIRGGGPGIILLRPEHAVVLHRGSKVTRVAGEEVVFTERLERVLDLVDLRGHILVMLGVKATTKDGIGIKFVLIIICRVDPTGAPDDSQRLYPFNPETVARVVHGQNVEEDKRQKWQELVMQKARKAAYDVMSTYVLDRLLAAEEPDDIPRAEIKARIKDRLTAEMADSGIDILGVAMGNIEPDEEPGHEPGRAEMPAISVTEQRVSSWQAKWQRRVTERTARGEAEAIRIVEEARAKALTELVNAVEEGFRVMASHGNAAEPGKVIALSFVNAVEQMLAKKELPTSLGGADPQRTLQNIQRRMLGSTDLEQES